MFGEIMAAVSVGSSILGGMSADKAAEKAAKEQSKLTYRQRQEEIRMRKLTARQQVGLSKATVYASNLQFSGTSKKYTDALNMENMREIAFAREAANLERQAILAGARGAGDSLFAQAAGDTLGFAAQQLGTYYASKPATPNYGGKPSADVSPVYQSTAQGGGGSYSSTPNGVTA